MNPVEIVPARDGEFGVNLFVMVNQWSPNGNAVQSRPLSITEALELSKQLNQTIQQVLRGIIDNPAVKSCRCGCGAPWADSESDEYVDSHVECDSCGEDWPVDDCTVERHTEYADQPGQPYYFCPECSNVEDERDPKQDDEERFNMELTLGDL